MGIEPENPGVELAKAAAESMGKEGINKIANAIGNIFPFWDTKRIAVETYVENIQKSNLSPVDKMMAIANTKHTFKYLKNQSNIAKIAMETAQKGTDFSEASKVDDEWLARYMDSAKFVSDEEVQVIWGKVLAGEFENPGSTPPSVTRILTEITTKYAKAFQIICSLAVRVVIEDASGHDKKDWFSPLVPENYDYLQNYSVHFSCFNELKTLGLIQLSASGYGWNFSKDASSSIRFHVVYGNQTSSTFQFENGRIPSGVVMLTDAGISISKFITPKTIEGHFEAVCKYFEKEEKTWNDMKKMQSDLDNMQSDLDSMQSKFK